MLTETRQLPSTVRVKKHSSFWRNDTVLNSCLFILAFLTYVPFISVVINSLKDNRQYLTQFWLPAFPLHFENYLRAWPPIWESLQNSLLYSIPTVILVLAVSGLTGYTFARYSFLGREVLFMAILVLIMLPGILLVIPMFVQIVKLGWINSVQAIVLPWSAVQIPFGMFLMRTFFETLPKEYFEAARLDGAGEFQLLYRIAIPLAMPAFSTLGILTLLFTWNDIIWPLIVIFDSDRHPISIGVLAFAGALDIDYGALFAGYVLASLPLIILFAFTARRFMAGLQGGLSL
jgi:ABC-type glycerol-3-phosphate transport system permease component